MTDATDDETRTFDTRTFVNYSFSGKKKKKGKNKKEAENLGEELNNQLVIKDIRSIATQTDFQWKKMALRWKNAKIMHASFLDENDFFEPDPERIQAATSLLREIAQQMPDLFHILTLEELQDLSDVLSNIGLKRSDGKTNLMTLLNSIPLGSEAIKRLSTSTVSTPFRRDSLASSIAGRKWMERLPGVFDADKGELSILETENTEEYIAESQSKREQSTEDKRGESEIPSIDVETKGDLESQRERLSSVELKLDKVVTEAVKSGPPTPSSGNRSPRKSFDSASETLESRQARLSKGTKLKSLKEDDVSDLFTTSNITEDLFFTGLMEIDFKVEFADDTIPSSKTSSRGSSLFTERYVVKPTTSFERDQLLKKQIEEQNADQRHNDPSLYLFGKANKCVDTRDLAFDPYDLKRVW